MKNPQNFKENHVGSLQIIVGRLKPYQMDLGIFQFNGSGQVFIGKPDYISAIANGEN